MWCSTLCISSSLPFVKSYTSAQESLCSNINAFVLFGSKMLAWIVSGVSRLKHSSRAHSRATPYLTTKTAKLRDSQHAPGKPEAFRQFLESFPMMRDNDLMKSTYSEKEGSKREQRTVEWMSRADNISCQSTSLLWAREDTMQWKGEGKMRKAEQSMGKTLTRDVAQRAWYVQLMWAEMRKQMF